jgi:hypothetical protein
VVEEVETVARRLQHTHSCGSQNQANLRVNGKEIFAAVVELHLANTKEVANALRGARR